MTAVTLPPLDGIQPFKLPMEKTVLWDHTGCGRPYILHLAVNQMPKVYIKESVLQRAFKSLDSSDADHAFGYFHGSMTASGGSSSVGVSVMLNDFKETLSVKFPCADDFVVPVALSYKTKGIYHWSTCQYFEDLKDLASADMVSLDLSQFMRLRIVCSYNGIQCDVKVEMSTLATAFTASPILPVPVLRSGLTELLSKSDDMVQQYGYLVIDQNKRIVVVLETEPNLPVLPLVGIWVSGVSSVRHPHVWAACVRYISSPLFQNRLCLWPLPFLLILYHPDTILPTFYNCTCESGNKWPVFTSYDGQAFTNLPRIPLLHSKMLLIDLLTLGDKCKELDEADRKIQRQELQHSPTVISSNAEDMPQPSYKLPFQFQFDISSQPRVKDLSVISNVPETAAMSCGHPQNNRNDVRYCQSQDEIFSEIRSRFEVKGFSNPLDAKFQSHCADSINSRTAVTSPGVLSRQLQIPGSAPSNDVEKYHRPLGSSSNNADLLYLNNRVTNNLNINPLHEALVQDSLPSSARHNIRQCYEPSEHVHTRLDGDEELPRQRPIHLQSLEKIKEIHKRKSGTFSLFDETVNVSGVPSMKSPTGHLSPSSFNHRIISDSAIPFFTNDDDSSHRVSPIATKNSIETNQKIIQKSALKAPIKSAMKTSNKNYVETIKEKPSSSQTTKKTPRVHSNLSAKKHKKPNISPKTSQEKPKEATSIKDPKLEKSSHKPVKNNPYSQIQSKIKSGIPKRIPKHNSVNCKTAQKQTTEDAGSTNVADLVQQLVKEFGEMKKKIDSQCPLSDLSNVEKSDNVQLGVNRPTSVANPLPHECMKEDGVGNAQYVNEVHATTDDNRRLCSIATMTSFASQAKMGEKQFPEAANNLQQMQHSIYESSDVFAHNMSNPKRRAKGMNFDDVAMCIEQTLRLRANHSPEPSIQVDLQDYPESIYCAESSAVQHTNYYNDCELNPGNMEAPSQSMLYHRILNNVQAFLSNKEGQCDQQPYEMSANAPHCIPEDDYYPVNRGMHETKQINKRRICTKGTNHISIVQQSCIITRKNCNFGNDVLNSDEDSPSHFNCGAPSSKQEGHSNLTFYGLSDSNMSFATRDYFENYGLRGHQHSLLDRQHDYSDADYTKGNNMLNHGRHW